MCLFYLGWVMVKDKLGELKEEVFDIWCEPLENALSITESPIEKLFLLGLLSEIVSFEIEYARDGLGWKEYFTAHAGNWIIESQVKITPKIRVDFLFSVKYNPKLKIVIECDGHDFHEKTKEQARRDKNRDRELLKLGFKVLHYTGSEIWENPKKPLSDIKDLLIAEVKTDAL